MTNIDHISSRLGRHYVLATDGGSVPNPGLGSWAFVGQLRHRAKVLHDRTDCGLQYGVTNNRMELTAVIRGLESLEDRTLPVIVGTDSRYVSDGFQHHLPKWAERGWRKADGKKVLNEDLWRALQRAAEGLDLYWVWLPSHAGNILNERADALVAAARRNPALRAEASPSFANHGFTIHP